jgi:hypothetical protein
MSSKKMFLGEKSSCGLHGGNPIMGRQELFGVVAGKKLYKIILFEEERNFIDLGRSTLWVSKEYVLIDP